MSERPEQSAELRFALPNVPRPPDVAALSAAIESACSVFGDIGAGHGIEALRAAEIVKACGHSARCAVWAIWDLVDQKGLQAHPRPNIEVVRESGAETLELAHDPRPRYANGQLVPDGPFPVPQGEPIPWFAAILEPKHAILDRIHLSVKSPAAESRTGPGETSASALADLEARTPPLDASSHDWLTPAEVKKLDRTDIESLRVLRAKGRRNAAKLFGVDKSGRHWRKPTSTSTKVYYWKPSLLSQRRDA